MRIVTIKKYYQGFTLVEVIAVIVILAIVIALSGQFVMKTTSGYQSTQTRSRLVNTGRQAVESMSRQLRVSLSYSVRVTNSNACLEFLPIVGGGYYIDQVPDSSNGAPASATITVSPFTVDTGTAQYVSIGAASSTEVYGVSPASLATVSSYTSTVLTLSSTKTWQRNSLMQRFFLLDKPQAFCIVSGQLRYYSGQDATSSSVNTASAYSVLATNVSAATGSTFSTTASSDNRNTNVLFNITFVDGSESVALNQSVMIRNVP